MSLDSNIDNSLMSIYLSPILYFGSGQEKIKITYDRRNHLRITIVIK